MAKKSQPAEIPGWEVEPAQSITQETMDAITDESLAKGVDFSNFMEGDEIPLGELTEESGQELLKKLQEADPGQVSPILPSPPGSPEGETTLTVEGGEPVNLEDVQKTVEAMELNVKTRNTTESLKCILTDDEIRRYGIAQARANAEIATAEEELQSVKSQYKSRVDAATANRNDMAKRINNGYEFRQVDCIERWDYSSNIITVRRQDTYETISRRTMSREEMQRKLF